MEAGGIEPPSRDTSDEASTCVVVWFDLGLTTPSDRLRQAQHRGFLTLTSRCRPVRAGLLLSPRPPAGVTDGTGGLFRLPCATWNRWQLSFLSGVLPGLLTTWTRHLDLRMPGRAQIAPGSRCPHYIIESSGRPIVPENATGGRMNRGDRSQVNHEPRPGISHVPRETRSGLRSRQAKSSMAVAPPPHTAPQPSGAHVAHAG